MTTGADPARRPRVTVVTAAYNAEAFLAATLLRVRTQTFADFEHLVFDDGSRDGTADVVRRLMADDPRLRLIGQTNRGLAATRNEGIRAARGEFVAFLDHDDAWHPEKLSSQVAALDAHPEAGVASCYSAVIAPDGTQLGWRLGGDANGDVYWQMLEWDAVSGGSVPLCRRTTLERAGFFDETLPMRSDWDMWIRLAHLAPFVTVPRTLVGYARSPASASRQYARFAAAGVAILDRAARADARITPGFHRFCRARDTFAVACVCAIDDQLGLAWRYLGQSLATTPLAVLRAPRRWAMVAVLVLKTMLPAPVFARVFGLLSRWRFGLRTDRAFDAPALV
ncbi:MAG: glycosyltransferase [Candidatus Binatia bacterium]